MRARPEMVRGTQGLMGGGGVVDVVVLERGNSSFGRGPGIELDTLEGDLED